jgi:hypothetical protein
MVALWIYYSPTNDDLIGTAPVRQAATMRASCKLDLHSSACFIHFVYPCKVYKSEPDVPCRCCPESQMPRGERRLKWQ